MQTPDYATGHGHTHGACCGGSTHESKYSRLVVPTDI